MDLTRFSDDDWALTRARLKKKEGGFDEKAFIGWLLAPGRDEDLTARLGAKWALSDALTVATGKKTREPKGVRTVVNEAAPEMAIPSLSREEFAERVKVKVQAYEDAFTDILPQDRAMIWAVAQIEVNIDEVNKLMQDEFLSATPSADRAQKYGSALNGLMGSHVAIQKMMGWDKATRNKSKDERTAQEEALEVIEEAGIRLEEVLVEVKHTCGVLIGQYLTAFKEFRFEFRIAKCPLCGMENVLLVHEPSADDLRAIEPDWVGAEERKYAHVLKGVEGE